MIQVLGKPFHKDPPVQAVWQMSHSKHLKEPCIVAAFWWRLNVP